MGRVKVFDETDALAKAMRLFWRQGYANTSIKQLLSEMNMLNGSFYHSFKDKKTIFLKSLDFYNQKVTYKRQEALAGHDDFSNGIRALFSEIFKTLESKKEPKGCLIVNSMAEEVLCIDELKDYLENDFKIFVKFLTERAQLSIDHKYTTGQIEAKQLAYILVTYIQGLFRVSKTATSIKQLKKQTEYFLCALDL